jgi:predicted RNA binding protein YcfA (HicA-like mRNA interferase family)
VIDAGLPLLRPLELTRALERMGFRLTRKSPGSHMRYGHEDGRRTTVPMHEGRTVSRGLLRKIPKDIGISVEELKSYL